MPGYDVFHFQGTFRRRHRWVRHLELSRFCRLVLNCFELISGSTFWHLQLTQLEYAVQAWLWKHVASGKFCVCWDFELLKFPPGTNWVMAQFSAMAIVTITVFRKSCGSSSNPRRVVCRLQLTICAVRFKRKKKDLLKQSFSCFLFTSLKSLWSGEVSTEVNGDFGKQLGFVWTVGATLSQLLSAATYLLFAVQVATWMTVASKIAVSTVARCCSYHDAMRVTVTQLSVTTTRRCTLPWRDTVNTYTMAF